MQRYLHLKPEYCALLCLLQLTSQIPSGAKGFQVHLLRTLYDRCKDVLGELERILVLWCVISFSRFGIDPSFRHAYQHQPTNVRTLSRAQIDRSA